MTADVIVIGGGPSGTVAARFLASWGHTVRLLTRPVDPMRALANSLPPSTSKLLHQSGIADIVEHVGYQTGGNTVWWGDDERVEHFAPGAVGYQVDRAQLDPRLLERAVQDGVHVVPNARVLRVRRDDITGVMSVSYMADAAPSTCQAPIVLDCSGRAGVVALGEHVRKQVPGGRMQALLGVWMQPGGWSGVDTSHTFIETCDEGWAWAMQTAGEVRHVGVMVDGATSRIEKHSVLEVSYPRLLATLPRLYDSLREARLMRVDACDASVYTATRHAGPGFVLVGDAGCTLNPLSSFGVKKALASAWFGAVVAHTTLRHPERAQTASRFFSRWTTELWTLNLLRSRDFAREALERHRSAFWSAQASASVDERVLPLDERLLVGQPDVRDALARLRASDRIVFERSPEATIVSAPIVRGHEIAIEPAVSLGPDERDVTRYLRGVDLVAVLALIASCTSVPEVIERYQRTHTASSPPDIIAALAVLIARGAIRLHDPARSAPR